MRIELEEPFKTIWSHGHLRIDKISNRKLVDLINNKLDGTRTTISYARYLMSVKLGAFISKEYEVDHKDDDRSNDDPNNLQLLTGEQNRLKQKYKYIMFDQVCYGYHCAYCEQPFILTERHVKMRLSSNVELAFCGRSCAARYNSAISKRHINNSISEDNIKRIVELKISGLSSYKIAEETKLARNTVMKYWK